MGLRTVAWRGFLRFTESVYATREGVDAGGAARRAVHLHASPRAGRDAVVERPAPAPDRARRVGRAERRGAVETRGERTRGLEPVVDRLHHLRSEEHTSELQSRPHLVCRLLLEKKND